MEVLKQLQQQQDLVDAEVNAKTDLPDDSRHAHVSSVRSRYVALILQAHTSLKDLMMETVDTDDDSRASRLKGEIEDIESQIRETSSYIRASRSLYKRK
jgi:hypothetical protein